MNLIMRIFEIDDHTLVVIMLDNPSTMFNKRQICTHLLITDSIRININALTLAKFTFN